MAASVCGKCGRGYPKYLDKCPNCTSDGTPRKSRREAARSRTRGEAERAPPANAAPLATNAPALDGEAPEFIPGQPCPTCGRKVPKTGKQRYAEWKARQK